MVFCSYWRIPQRLLADIRIRTFLGDLPLKEKSLVTWFALGNTVDITLTLIVLVQGLATEFNPLARQVMARGDTVQLLIVKIAFSAILIGAYALSTSLNNRLRYSTEKSLQIAVFLVWGVQVWNLLNLIAIMVL